MLAGRSAPFSSIHERLLEVRQPGRNECFLRTHASLETADNLILAAARKNAAEQRIDVAGQSDKDNLHDKETL
jgi:hypothetical protein